MSIREAELVQARGIWRVPTSINLLSMQSGGNAGAHAGGAGGRGRSQGAVAGATAGGERPGGHGKRNERLRFIRAWLQGTPGEHIRPALHISCSLRECLHSDLRVYCASSNVRRYVRLDRGIVSHKKPSRGIQWLRSTSLGCAQCRFIFRAEELDLGRLATAFALLRLPRMPELRSLGDLPNFTPSLVDPNTVKVRPCASLVTSFCTVVGVQLTTSVEWNGMIFSMHRLPLIILFVDTA